MQFYLNSGQANAVQIKCGLGGDTVGLLKSPKEDQGIPTEVLRRSNGSPTEVQRNFNGASRNLPACLTLSLPNPYRGAKSDIRAFLTRFLGCEQEHGVSRVSIDVGAAARAPKSSCLGVRASVTNPMLLTRPSASTANPAERILLGPGPSPVPQRSGVSCALPIGNPRYSRLQICVTPEGTRTAPKNLRRTLDYV
jgi:hypothetical protein